MLTVMFLGPLAQFDLKISFMSTWTYYLFNFWGLRWERFGVAFCGQKFCYILFISIRFNFTLLWWPLPGFLAFLVWILFCLFIFFPPFFLCPKVYFRILFVMVYFPLNRKIPFGGFLFWQCPPFFGVMEEAGQEIAEGCWPFVRGKYSKTSDLVDVTRSCLFKAIEPWPGVLFLPMIPGGGLCFNSIVFWCGYASYVAFDFVVFLDL